MTLALSEVKEILSRTPRTLRTLLDELPQGLLDANEGSETFSPRDVLGHLIHGEKTDWIPRVRLILATGEAKPFIPFDRFGFRDASQGESIRALLDEFESLRRGNLGHLEALSLTDVQLSFTGRHPELGVVTLGQLLATWAVHDLNHLGQTARVMSKRYAAEVGPWRAYLGILNR